VYTQKKVYDELWKRWFRHTMPRDAYKLCNGRLHISLTVVTRYGGFKNLLVNQFYSNDDLFEACMASSCLPYLTTKRTSRKFRGEYALDGGITNNTPIFTDGVRRQLVFRLFDVEYPWRLLVNAEDSCIGNITVCISLYVDNLAFT